MEPVCFKRDLQQLHSRSSLVFWYSCFNAFLSYLIFSLFISLFIRSNSLTAWAVKFFLALLFTLIITFCTLKKFKPAFYISPHAYLTISNTALNYVNPPQLNSPKLMETNLSYAPLDYEPAAADHIELPFSDLLQISFFTDCLSPIPYSITLKTDSFALSLDGFENMDQIRNYITSSAPSDCKIKWQNTFFPVLHMPSLIIFTIYLFLLDLLVTFVTPAFYLLIIIVPLSFGIFHLIQALFAQQKSVSWHITKLTTSLIFAFLALIPVLAGIAVSLYK